LNGSPSQAFAQWHIDTFFTSLAYRCGGSTGIASFDRVPVSRLTAAENFQTLRCGTLHDFSAPFRQQNPQL
jgi:hypothetical protein